MLYTLRNEQGSILIRDDEGIEHFMIKEVMELGKSMGLYLEIVKMERNEAVAKSKEWESLGITAEVIPVSEAVES